MTEARRFTIPADLDAERRLVNGAAEAALRAAKEACGTEGDMDMFRVCSALAHALETAMLDGARGFNPRATPPPPSQEAKLCGDTARQIIEASALEILFDRREARQ